MMGLSRGHSRDGGARLTLRLSQVCRWRRNGPGERSDRSSLPRGARNEGVLSVAGELVAAEHVHHLGSQELLGPEGVTGAVRGLRGAFPDWHFEIDDLVSAGDRVVVRWTATGTHEGMFDDVAPTGRLVEWIGCDWFRIWYREDHGGVRRGGRRSAARSAHVTVTSHAPRLATNRSRKEPMFAIGLPEILVMVLSWSASGPLLRSLLRR